MMLMFGSSVGHPEKLDQFAEPGLQRSMGDEPYHRRIPASNNRSIYPLYAAMMREACEVRADALVLMHDDLEFRDEELSKKLRAVFASDPNIAVVGLIGARGVMNLRWWQGDRKGRVEDVGYGLHSFGFDAPAHTLPDGQCVPMTADVDSIDGMMIALSPWACANLALDESQNSYHGYDAELAFQARAKGKRVVVADITAFHHSKGGFTQGLVDAEAVFQKRWGAARSRPVCSVCSRVECKGHATETAFNLASFVGVDRAAALIPEQRAGLDGLQAEINEVAASVQARHEAMRYGDDPRLPDMIRRVQEAGTDSLSHFGNGYTHEGGLYLQQNPEEFARLALLLEDRCAGASYLEIGSASGGAARFLSLHSGFHCIRSIDDGKHPRASAQDEHFGACYNDFEQFEGDSHSPEAAAWLAEQPRPSVAFIDGDHSYEGVTADINMVLPRCEPGALIILHDTVACDGVRRAWNELLASGRARKVAEYIGAERPLGIGVAEVVNGGRNEGVADATQARCGAAAGDVSRARTDGVSAGGGVDLSSEHAGGASGGASEPARNGLHVDGQGRDEAGQAVKDPWSLLRTPGPWTVEQLSAMYDAHRGEPVSSEPFVHMIIPSYRESYDIVKLCDPSRVAVIKDLNDHGINVCRSDIDGDSLVQRMRQRAMHLFLKGPATHLLWCDLDIEVRDPTCVRKMLRSGFDLVGGACPFKNITPNVVCNFLPSMAQTLDRETLELPHGCLEVHDVGTGFQLVSRRAILQMMAAHPELLHWSRSQTDYGEPLFALYDTGVVEGTYESEDFLFCRYWQQLGGRVYVYVPASFRHYGTHGFEASIMEKLGLEAV